MKFLFKIFFLIVLCAQVSNAQKSINLFNQQNLEGWYAFSQKTGKHKNASEVFSVENNMIRLYGKQVGYLMSNKSFKNFKLTVEFKWNTDEKFARKAKSKNSGIMYLVPKETPDVLWPKGIQCQVKEGATGDFILLQNVSLEVKCKNIEPGKSVVVKRFKDGSNPIGEWNTVEIICKHGKITQKINGKLVNKGKNASVTEGRILLQYEGFPIDFKRVEIKEI